MTEPLRVGLDVSGPVEPLGNWMSLLAEALPSAGCGPVVRFATGPESQRGLESHLMWRGLARPWWRRGRGPAVDRFLPPLDIVHVAGLSTPPTHSARLVVSVDDLRPLREAERDRQRVIQLVRAAEHGAQLVASSRAASLEVQAALGLRRGQVVIVPPAVPWPSSMVEGDALVVNLTGRATEFVQWGRQLVERSTSLGHRVIVLASRAAAIRIRQAGLNVDLRDRREAPAVLGEARAVVHLSDGARFPTFTVAAAAAGIPTAASATAVNRELLEGASLLVDDTEPEALLETIGTILADEARRAVLVAAGRARARDFSADVAARRFLALYESLVRVGVSS